MRSFSRAFTLIELMLVMAIMGLLGTVSIGGFRAMRRGMEQSSVMRNVDQFIHNAYQRALMDRQPTVVYFWNETREDEQTGEKLVVVGHAVAVRRSGRITSTEGGFLIDEFGDLRFSVATDDEGDEDDASTDEVENGTRMFLYKMNGNESGGIEDNRSAVSSVTLKKSQHIAQVLTDVTWTDNHNGDDAKIAAYGWKLDSGSGPSWNVGDAYGLEFATITLPNNYIFGTSFSKDAKDPVEPLSDRILCSPGSANGTVKVYAIRSNGGEPTAMDFKNNTTQAADSDLGNQTY